MQRQRKRDLNLKPNRVLDKRSSRGMIYENEELRHRTLAIADDVDRGHSDIKKLRKENDHLKREIWSLRDECEKLEEILKKMVHSGATGLDPNDLPYPELFMDRNDEDYDDEASSFMNDEDQDQASLNRTMFMMDDDTGSVIEMDEQQQQNVTFSDGADPSSQSSTQNPQEFGPQHSMRFPGVSTNLEAVREETESLMTLPQSDTPVQDHIQDQDALPDPTHFNENQLNADLNAGNNPLFPVIQITPASSPSSAPLDSERSPQPPLTPDPNHNDNEPPSSPESIQEGGCITVVPKMFQVTSQMHIEETEEEDKTASSLSALPPPSPSPSTSQKFKKSPNRKNTKISTTSSPTHRHSLHSGQISSTTNKRQTHPPASSASTDLNRQLTSTPPGGHFGLGYHQFDGSVGYIVNGCCHSCYQSEPSLTSGATDDHFHRPLGLGFDPLMYSLSHFHPNKPNNGWNSIDKNLVVGYFINEHLESSKIKPQNIIDELEVKFDVSLEKIKGIRMLPGRVFISLKDPESVSALLREFGSEASGERKEFLIKDQCKIVFVDGSQEGYAELTLSGIPPEVSDLVVISVLNQYGQVVAPMERRNYKGVDISERAVRMHLVKKVPAQLLIGGYEVSLVEVISSNNVPSDECQEICNTNIRQLVSPSVGGGVAHVHPNALKAPVITSNVKDNPTTIPCHNSPVTCHPTPTSSQTQQLSIQPPHKGATSPGEGQTLKAHQAVSRSTSSNPRLESGVPISPILIKRQPSASVCAASLPPEQHPSKLFLKNPKLQKNNTSPNTNANSAPTLIPGNPKKPLSRLLGSSPASLGSKVQPTSPIEQQQQDPTTPGTPVPNTSPNTGGLRAAFYRNLSLDPRRRGSNTSQFQGENNNNDKMSGAYSRRNSGNVFQGRFAGQGGHPHLTQMNSNSSSQFDRRDSVRRFGGGSGNLGVNGKSKPLPWCGCWGNGCV